MKESVIHHQPGPAESGKERQALGDIFQPRGVAVSSASSLLFPFGSSNTMGVGALCYVSMAMMHYKKWEKALLCEVSRVPEPGDVLKIDTGESCAVFPAPRAAVVPSQERVYLDHNATTAPHPEVREAMVRCLAGNFGNPSAIYREGREAKSAMEEARRKLANLMGATTRRIIFTGGGSEANNMVIKGVARSGWRTWRGSWETIPAWSVS